MCMSPTPLVPLATCGWCSKMPRHTRDAVGTGEVLDLFRERLTDLSAYDLNQIAIEAMQEISIRSQERAQNMLEAVSSARRAQ